MNKRTWTYYFFLLSLCVHCVYLCPFVISAEMEEFFAKGITVDLREPEYCDGVLKTEKGGVVQGPDMRLQARKIVYTRKIVDGKPLLTVEAEEDLMVEFGKYLFVGSRLEYDFQNHQGI